jgi:hypothetical protein
MREMLSSRPVPNVRGILFADYVRMIRTRQHRQIPVNWTKHLEPHELDYLRDDLRIDPDAWYPMASVERLGRAIRAEVAGNDLRAVRTWGRISVMALRAAQPHLVAVGDPVETLMRFRVLRATLFDFEALDVPMITEGCANVEIRYHMGPVAEEAASVQTLGFLECLLEVAGATEVTSRFVTRSWAGDARTVIAFTWQSPVQI